VRGSIPRLYDEVPAEIGFGSEGIMGSAAERDVSLAVLTTPCERSEVMELEGAHFAAALSGRIDVSALPAVSLEYCAPHGRGHVPPAPAGHAFLDRPAVVRWLLACRVRCGLRLARFRAGAGAWPRSDGVASLLEVRDERAEARATRAPWHVRSGGRTHRSR